MMKGIGFSRLLVGTALVGACCPAMALGQVTEAPGGNTTVAAKTDEPTNEDIVVTGIRRSLADAADIKRNSATISDVISAEDIGRFPDQNLAESLQRITGVQITRARGEGNTISVRGLSPNLTRTQYNGRTLATPSGNRAFSFTSLTSDFVSAVEVLKSPTADMIDGGLAGTVNVRTRRPLEVGRNSYNFIAEGVYEDNRDSVTPHIGGQITQVFADGKVGINLGVGYEGRKARQVSLQAFGLEQVRESTRVPPIDYNSNGVIYSGPAANEPVYGLNHGIEYHSQEGYSDRLTAIGTLELQPTDSLNLYGDVFYSRFDDDNEFFNISSRFTNVKPVTPNAVFGVRSSTINADNIITQLDLDAFDQRANTRNYRNVSTTFSAAVGGTLDIDRLKISSEATYSRAKRVLDGWNTNVTSRASGGYDIRDDLTQVPVVLFSRGYDPNNSPNSYNLTGLDIDVKQPNTDRNMDARLDLTYAVSEDSFLRSVKLGGYYGDRAFRYTQRSTSLSSEQLAAALNLPFQANVEQGSVPFGSYLMQINRDGYLPGGPAVWTVVDRDRLLEVLPVSRILEISPVVDQPASNFRVQEKVWAVYARADFAGPDERFAGNIGLRYVRTDQTSSGAAPDLTKLLVLRGEVVTRIPGAEPISIDNKYSEWLPSLNAKYNITDDLIVRFAAARAMTRPDLNLLRPSFNVNANVRRIDAGNPNLRPYLANQADLSLEYYIGRGGLISAAVFYKDVSNFIVTGQTTESLVLNLEAGGTRTDPFVRNRPVNAQSSKVKGVELGIQLPLTFVPAPFDGLGVIANVTYIDAEGAARRDGGPTLPLPGVSKYSYNLGAFYEKSGFGIRASYNFRDRFDTGNDDFGDFEFTRAYGQLDVSASYDLTPNFTVTADVTNATDSNLQQETVIGIVKQFNSVGRRYTAGIRAKF